MKEEKPTLKEKIQYHLNNLLQKGMVFKVMILFVVSVIFLLLTTLCLVIVSPDSTIKLGWEALVHLLDSGVISTDDNATVPYLIVMLVATLGGMVFFGTLVGIINDGLSSRLSNINSGHYKIIEKDHIIIVGFNDEIYGILQELVEYNKEIIKAGKKPHTLVVLDDTYPVEEMMSLVESSIGRHRRIRILYRRGSSFSPESIIMCGAENAKCVIINAKNDYQTIKWIITVSNALGVHSKTNVTAVVKEIKNVVAAECIQGDNVRVLFPGYMINNIISHSSANVGLSKVVEELTNFKKSQFVTLKNKIFTGNTLSEIHNALKSVTVVGKIEETGKINMDPDVFDDEVKDGESVIFIADDEFVVKREVDTLLANINQTVEEIPYKEKVSVIGKPQNVLLLRFSRLIEMLVEEQISRLPEGSKIYIACSPKYDRFLKLLKLGYEEQGLEIIELKQISYHTIEMLIDRCNPDKCIIQSDYVEPSDALSDSDETVYKDLEIEDEEVMLAILFIRDIAKRKGIKIDVTAQLQNSLVEAPETAENGEGDYITVSSITSHILTQVVYNPKLLEVFKLLFLDREYTVKVIKADIYVETDNTTEYDIRSISALLKTHGKTFVGIKKQAETIINPIKSKKWIFDENDYFIVIEKIK